MHLLTLSELLISILNKEKKRKSILTNIGVTRSSDSGTTREGTDISQLSHLAHQGYSSLGINNYSVKSMVLSHVGCGCGG